MEANYFLALVLYARGERFEGRGDAGGAAACYGEALTCLDRTLDLKPDHARAHLYRGLVLKRLGRKKKR